jgi:Protein of unknown function (DUF3149)
MDALRELFTTWIGIMSLGVIVGVIVMGVVMNRWFAAQIAREDAQRLSGRR